MSQLIMDTMLSPEQRKFTEQIMTSSESLLILINDILDLTKVEAGKLELSSVEFDVRQVVQHTHTHSPHKHAHAKQTHTHIHTHTR